MFDDVDVNKEEQALDVVQNDEQDVINKDVEQEQHDDQSDDEMIITIGNDPFPEEVEEERKAPEWVKELRKNDREKTRKIRELEEQLKAKNESQQALKLGEKPTLESSEYDPEKYEQNLAKWFEDKRKVDEEAKKIEEATKQSQQAWNDRLKFYDDEKAKLKVKNFDDAEALVKEKLSETQQGILIQGAQNPAIVILALSMNPKRLADLSAISDPIKYAFAASKLEAELKISRKEAPPPERKINGTGSITGSIDSNLDKLRSEAERTGDYSKVIAYKRSKK